MGCKVLCESVRNATLPALHLDDIHGMLASVPGIKQVPILSQIGGRHMTAQECFSMLDIHDRNEYSYLFE